MNELYFKRPISLGFFISRAFIAKGYLEEGSRISCDCCDTIENHAYWNLETLPIDPGRFGTHSADRISTQDAAEHILPTENCPGTRQNILCQPEIDPCLPDEPYARDIQAQGACALRFLVYVMVSWCKNWVYKYDFQFLKAASVQKTSHLNFYVWRKRRDLWLIRYEAFIVDYRKIPKPEDSRYIWAKIEHIIELAGN